MPTPEPVWKLFKAFGPLPGPFGLPQVADDGFTGGVNAGGGNNVAGERGAADDVVVDLGGPGIIDGAECASGIEGAGEIAGAFGGRGKKSCWKARGSIVFQPS